MYLEQGHRLLVLEFQISIWAVLIYVSQIYLLHTREYKILTDMKYSI